MMIINSLLVILEWIQALKIYNLKLNLFLILIITSLLNTSVYAIQKGLLEYDDNRVDYSLMNPEPIQIEADYYLDTALATQDFKIQKQLLEVASGKYFLLSKINPQAITPYVQLARIYDITKHDKYAKEYFYKATNLEYLNPFANFYFGEYYFKRNDFRRALKYYQIAYQNGYNEIYELNIRLAMIYEKLGDLENARKYYNTAITIDSSDSNIINKIEQLNQLNYDSSEYYHNFIRE